MNDIAKRNEAYVARYEPAADPFASFANEGGAGVVGKLLTCKKGSWGIGADETTPPAGALYLAQIDTMTRGWLRWWGGVVTDADVGRVAVGFRVKPRFALGDNDPDEWERNPDNTPRDPWGKTFRMVLTAVAVPHDTLTFSSGSYGGELSFKELAGSYVAGREQHPAGACPVVELETGVWMSKNYGKQIRPLFVVSGWANPDDVVAGRKVLATPAAAPQARVKAKPAAKTMADEPDDEIPTALWK